jgi:hypothetical protein
MSPINITSPKYDPARKIRAAGSNIIGVRETSEQCIRADFHSPQPMTPKKLIKYRQVNQTVGKPHRHWGGADDRLKFPGDYAYGKKVIASESPSTLIKAQDFNGLADKFNDMKEATYASKKKEPLGHAFSRKYEWPSKIRPKHVFGLGSKGLENAKEMISPRRHMTIETETMATDLYKKSHNAYEPGEQRKRDYVWPVRPENFVFGFSEGKIKNGARDAIHHERSDEQFPRTVMVRKD